MIKIGSVDQYKEWVQKAKESGFSLSNCYYTADKLAELIRRERLMVLDTSFAILFIENEAGFYRCTYYISAERPVKKIQLDKPCVIEYIFKNEISEKNQAELACLEKMGFVLDRKSARMVLSASDAVCRAPGSAVVEFARQGDEAAILALFRAAFDPLYAYFPDEEELTQAIHTRKNPIFCIYEDRRLCAALYSQRQNRTASIRMLAVDPLSKGKGYGSNLLARYHKEFLAEANRFMHWTDCENQHAVSFYQKYGYSFDGCYAYEYVIR